MSPPLTYLLDTNIVSHLMRDAQGLVAQRYRTLLESPQPCRMVTSVVVQCELLYGLTKKPSPRLQAAFALQMAQLPVLDMDESVAPHYATLRTQLEQLGTPIGGNDALIAAHALALGATLVSADAEFGRVPGLQLENWLS
jgi:tRNA(fMet)-specific endonuclease VapC